MSAPEPQAPVHFRDAQHPYEPVRTAGPLVFIAGQLGVKDGALVTGGVQAEARQAFANRRALLAGEGLGLEDLVKVTVYLSSMTDRLAMDEVYVAEMPERLPTRTCIAVAELPFRARVELDAIAYREH
ncbi:RidA family protein [Pseudactinotalea terrae]|uniref:RidA family protein n=1 Tax=Pseudactinotalea terrae TaxID=1743262 RepID=UPI0012E12A24|nr:RidA family protein [Pseudactinotalea terrae]